MSYVYLTFQGRQNLLCENAVIVPSGVRVFQRENCECQPRASIEQVQKLIAIADFELRMIGEEYDAVDEG